MVAAGVVDPAKVVRAALQDAASMAGRMITTEALVAEKPELEKASGHAGAGMDDTDFRGRTGSTLGGYGMRGLRIGGCGELGQRSWRMTAAVAVARTWISPNPILSFLRRLEEDDVTARKVIRIRPGLGASGNPPHGDDAPDPVEVAALDSFPASDPPSWTGTSVR